MFGRRGVAVLVGCALGLAACSASGTLISGHLGTPEAISQQKGLTMYTATKVWHNDPKELPSIATPIAVELRNDGQSEVQVLLSDFVLVDDRGRQYRPLSAYLKPPPPPSSLPTPKGPREGFNPFAPQLGETWTDDANAAIRDRVRVTTRGDHQDDDPSHRQLGETWHGSERAVDPELEKLELSVTERTAANVPKTQDEAIAEIARRRGAAGSRPVTSGPARSNKPPQVKEATVDVKQRFAKPSKIKYGEVPEEVVAKKVNDRSQLAQFRDGPPPAFRIGDIKGFGYGFRAGLFVEQGEKSEDRTDSSRSVGGVLVRDPDWYNRPFYYAPGLRLFYWEGGRDLVFATKLAYPTDYWRRVEKIDKIYKGTLDNLQHVALPEGLLPTRSAAAGYLYFGKLPEDVREVHLYWDPKSSATQRQLARLSVSYKRR